MAESGVRLANSRLSTHTCSVSTIRIVAIIDGQAVDLGVPAPQRTTLEQASRLAVDLGADLGVPVVVLVGEADDAAPPAMREAARKRCAA